MVDGVYNTIIGCVADGLNGGMHYMDEYELGTNRSTVDAYALITQQDDVQ